MVVLLKDVLQQMEATDPNTGQYIAFDVTCCTYSRHRDEGGKMIEYKGARLSGDAVLQQARKTADKKAELLDIATNRNPFHRKNKTRNIVLPNGQIRKLRFRFITSFNNQKVVY